MIEERHDILLQFLDNHPISIENANDVLAEYLYNLLTEDIPYTNIYVLMSMEKYDSGLIEAFMAYDNTMSIEYYETALKKTTAKITLYNHNRYRKTLSIEQKRLEDRITSDNCYFYVVNVLDENTRRRFIDLKSEPLCYNNNIVQNN